MTNFEKRVEILESNSQKQNLAIKYLAIGILINSVAVLLSVLIPVIIKLF